MVLLNEVDNGKVSEHDNLGLAPRAALTWLTPPGRKRSKGNWALVGARGVFPLPAHPRLKLWLPAFTSPQRKAPPANPPLI